MIMKAGRHCDKLSNIIQSHIVVGTIPLEELHRHQWLELMGLHPLAVTS